MKTRKQLSGSALFVGQLILDHVARVEHVPTGDQKVEALETAEQPGGNAPVAALTCARLGCKPDLVSGIGNDLPGSMIEQAVRNAGIHWHPRAMTKTPTSTILPNEDGRGIVSPNEQDIVYTEEFPRLDIEGCRMVHVDGRQFEAALHYVKEARRLNVPTSIDAGKRRPRIEELLPHIDYAVVSKRFCDDMGRGVDEMLSDLRRHSKMAAVTLGKDGLRYSAGGGAIGHVRAFLVPENQTVDENGSGDIHNGARIYSQLTWPDRPWEWHFRFASAAVAWKIRRFGNQPPTLEQVFETLRTYGIRAAA